MFYSRLQQLAKDRGTTVTEVIRELKMSSGNLSRWKSGIVPSGKTLQKIADYFDVTTDFLLGNSDTRKPISMPCKAEDPTFLVDELSFTLHSEIHHMSNEQKQEILTFVRFLKSRDDT